MAKHAVSSKPSVFEGEVYPTTESGDLIITKYVKAKEVHVRFVDTGYETVTQAVTIKRGLVRDKSIPRTYGVGYCTTGEHKYVSGGISERAYSTWSGMMARCYNQDCRIYPIYGGRGVYVSDAWHDFHKFAEWYVPKHYDGCRLDKDILFRGNLCYGPDTCCLVPQHLNSIVSLPRESKKELPLGVFKEGKKYYSKVTLLGKSKSFGGFSDPESAFLAYKNYKESVIQKLATDYYNAGKITEDVRDALVGWEIKPYPRTMPNE